MESMLQKKKKNGISTGKGSGKDLKCVLCMCDVITMKKNGGTTDQLWLLGISISIYCSQTTRFFWTFVRTFTKRNLGQ